MLPPDCPRVPYCNRFWAPVAIWSQCSFGFQGPRARNCRKSATDRRAGKVYVVAHNEFPNPCLL